MFANRLIVFVLGSADQSSIPFDYKRPVDGAGNFPLYSFQFILRATSLWNTEESNVRLLSLFKYASDQHIELVFWRLF